MPLIEQRISKTIQDHFQEMHVKLVFKELKERFGFNVKLWEKQYKLELDNQARNVDAVGFFLKWGNMNINPVLNKILFRKEHYSTFNNLCTYVLNKRNN